MLQKGLLLGLFLACQTYAITLSRDTVFEVGFTNAATAGSVTIGNVSNDTAMIDSIKIAVDKTRFSNYEISFQMLPCNSLLCPSPCFGASSAGACPPTQYYNSSASTRKIKLAPGSSITLSGFRIGYCIRCITGKPAAGLPFADTITAAVTLFSQSGNALLTVIGGYEGKAGIAPQPMHRGEAKPNGAFYMVDIHGNRIAPARQLQGMPASASAAAGLSGASQGIYFLVDPGSSRLISSLLIMK